VPRRRVNALVLESTYGNHLHSQRAAIERTMDLLEDVTLSAEDLVRAGEH
jgi:Cft2 family RNA processing exonuclease